MLHNFTTMYGCSGAGLMNLLYDDPSCVNVTDRPLFHQADPFVLPPASTGARFVPVLFADFVWLLLFFLGWVFVGFRHGFYFGFASLQSWP